ncbi:MAG: aspartate/glutamate racemase family protein [Anaerovoracaceae bacterium]
MRKIGLVGGLGPEATSDFYRCLQFEVHKLTGRDVMAPVTIESIDPFKVIGYCDEKRYNDLSALLLKSINNLAAAGVRFATITAMAPHVVFPEIEGRAQVSIASMVDTTCAYCVNNGYKKIGLIGLESTMNESFLPWAFAAQKMDIVTPDFQDAGFISGLVHKRLKYQPITDEDRDRASGIINSMVTEKNIDALLIGCSELPSILSGIELDVPAVDALTVHAKAMATLVVEESDILKEPEEEEQSEEE